MTRRKKIVFALVAMGLAASVTAGGLLIVDIYLHGRYERSAGYNVWGYRGPRAGAKQRNEVRIAVLGGSTAYGYGVNWEDSIPALLERTLTTPSAPVSVVNLGYNNEGAYSLRFTLEDYRWLNYDVAVLYDGYNDVTLTPPDMNRQVFRRDSPIFRWTGYMPIFPVIFKEKAASLRTGGELSAAYDSQHKTVFRPGLAARGMAGVLSATVAAGDLFGRQLNHASTPEHQADAARVASDCEHPWTLYCESVAAAISYARSKGTEVLMVGQPELNPRHHHQQQQVAAMIAHRFGGDSHVHYASMADAVNLTDSSLSFDGMHLTAAGNRAVALKLADAVRPLIAH